MLREEDDLVTGVTNLFHVRLFQSRRCDTSHLIFTYLIHEVHVLQTDSYCRRNLANKTIGWGAQQNRSYVLRTFKPVAKKKKIMPSVEFEPTIPANERLHSYT